MARRREKGFTLLELAIFAAIVGITAALAIPNLRQFFADLRVKAAARSIADAFVLARAEAIRTGNMHVVFLQEERAGIPLVDGNGVPVPIVILNDGRPGSAGQNCRIDAGEPVQVIRAESDVSWGATFANADRAPNDPIPNGTPIAGGIGLRDGLGNPTTWVVFQPSGVPVGATPGCVLGSTGTGGGSAYVTNGLRDFGVILSPLGAIRVHAWNRDTASWRD